ncbi:hypothetical protein TH53_11040 [Pedobacter lusitanus]|uniref:DUF4268 domain-containing protein n=1 Tax=Pedobacter lusitanus TaxID=1503925 RepID=A0A0D0GRL5_9SPHI|nr:DUF4268 domain-containing protein [Pedobacter lusitanus]KIO77161.1 hypothetical protein TH53_11040 [Pedobacter lusitanus]
MYSKDQASKLKQAFWTAFGQYIAPQLSAEGLRVNWVNYKTGIKHLHFKLHADKKSAFIGIELSHPDTGVQELLFEQFKEFRNILNGYLNEDWEWQLHMTDENHKIVSRIFTTLPDVSVFKEEDWPKLISFFKPRIIALDEFWCDAAQSFEVFK